MAASCGMNMTGSNHDHGYENCPGYFSILSPSFEHLELSFRAALVIVKWIALSWTHLFILTKLHYYLPCGCQESFSSLTKHALGRASMWRRQAVPCATAHNCAWAQSLGFVAAEECDFSQLFQKKGLFVSNNSTMGFSRNSWLYPSFKLIDTWTVNYHLRKWSFIDNLL